MVWISELISRPVCSKITNSLFFLEYNFVNPDHRSQVSIKKALKYIEHFQMSNDSRKITLPYTT